MALYDSLRPFTILLSASLSVVLRVVVILYPWQFQLFRGEVASRPNGPFLIRCDRAVKRSGSSNKKFHFFHWQDVSSARNTN